MALRCRPRDRGRLGGFLIAASQVGAREPKTAPVTAAPPKPALVAEAPLLAGVPQRGAAVGSAQAPVTLVEYADLQCPYCAQWALHHCRCST